MQQCKASYTWQGNMVDYIFEPFMNWMMKIWYLSSIFRSKTSELCVLEKYNIDPGTNQSILLANCTNMHTFWPVGLFPHGGQKFHTVEGGSPKSWQLLTRDGWGYNLVHKWVFRQQKICEKETIYVILVLQCIAKTKHRSKTHPSPLKCPVK